MNAAEIVAVPTISGGGVTVAANVRVSPAASVAGGVTTLAFAVVVLA